MTLLPLWTLNHLQINQLSSSWPLRLQRMKTLFIMPSSGDGTTMDAGGLCVLPGRTSEKLQVLSQTQLTGGEKRKKKKRLIRTSPPFLTGEPAPSLCKRGRLEQVHATCSAGIFQNINCTLSILLSYGFY